MLFFISIQLFIDLFAAMSQQFHQFFAVSINATILLIIDVVVAMK